MNDNSCKSGTTQAILNGIKIVSHVYFLIFMIFNEWNNKNLITELYHELDRNFTLSVFRFAFFCPAYVLLCFIFFINSILNLISLFCYRDKFGINKMGTFLWKLMVCDDEMKGDLTRYVITDAVISLTDIVLVYWDGLFIFLIFSFKLIFVALDTVTFHSFQFNKRFNYRHSIQQCMNIIFHQSEVNSSNETNHCIWNHVDNNIILSTIRLILFIPLYFILLITVALNCALNFAFACCYRDYLGIQWMGACLSKLMVCKEETNDDQCHYALTDAIISISDVLIGLLCFLIVYILCWIKLVWLVFDELTFEYFKFNQRFNYRHSLQNLLNYIFHQKDQCNDLTIAATVFNEMQDKCAVELVVP